MLLSDFPFFSFALAAAGRAENLSPIQGCFDVYSSHGSSVRLPSIILMGIHVVTGTSDNPNRYAAHSTGCFHLEADNHILQQVFQ